MPMLTMLRDALAGVAFPCAAADLVGEGGHLVQHGVDAGDDVFAVDHDGSRLWARGARRGGRRGFP